MYGLRKMLEDELKRLRRLEQLAEAQLTSLPEGTVRVSVSNRSVQYYYRGEDCNVKNGRYLHKSEEQLAYLLVQRKYDKNLQKLLAKRIRQLSNLLEDYREDEVEEIYRRESVCRQRMIEPLEKPWDLQLKEWIQQEYQGKPFADTDKELYADKGHRVRSKTEKILADYFYKHNIPYHYEKPLYLEGYGFVYPDFTFFSRKYCAEIYWEHEGMMDTPSYVQSVLKKQECYEKNGIFLGERLIITQESSEYTLKTSEIERKVRKYLEE